MPLNFDSSRAPVTSQDFVALALAVKNAGKNDEADWIEWKSFLDLGSAEAKVSIARAVIGLANRPPIAASAHCEGRSYLLVGVQPGEVIGMDEVDPAVLEDRLRSFLGDDGPRFRPHWVSVDGRSVLIIEVAAPRDGDPVHHLRKDGIGGARDGDIFVRRGAKTTRASSVELRRLLERAKSIPELHGITLTLAEPREVPTIDFSGQAVEDWVSTTRRRLLASLPRPDPQELADRHLGIPKERAVFRWAQEYSEITRGLGSFSQRPEDRTPEQYKEEVERYLERCRQAVSYAGRRAAAEKLMPIKLVVSNETKDNYSAVRVVLYIPGAVEAVRPSKRATNEGRLPATPRPFGPRTAPALGQEVSRLPRAIIGKDSQINFLRHEESAVDIVNGGSATLTFSPFDLRPLDRDVPLAPFVLLAQVPFDEPLIASWQATSKSVRGVTTGTLEIPLANRPIPLHDLVDHYEQ
ncbi:AlbA family DNA-binding domain-containing protein [Micromonospora tulbaghiae]|uniref:AlbA family DNA-binding domain-containing protein n=1 Tax=Micromonospora tulbaghiae TaxID=479978 RepID=UPI00341025E3